eukprot:scaffold18262_cov67-Phaeocystis_antarctica.AAC.2
MLGPHAYPRLSKQPPSHGDDFTEKAIHHHLIRGLECIGARHRCPSPTSSSGRATARLSEPQP